MSGKINWFNIVNTGKENKNNYTFFPPPQVILENEMKTQIEYKCEINRITGKEVFKKYIRSSRCKNVQKKISKASIERKSNLIKFGFCKKQLLGKIERGVTTPCPDEIFFEWEHEKQKEKNVTSKKLIQKNQQNILLKELVPKFRRETGKKIQKQEQDKSQKFQNSDEIEETPTIRILDLPRNASFDDIRILVHSFKSKHIKLPRDNENSKHNNRGYAFITFDNHLQAEYALKSLNGHGYGTNILHVEWSRNYLNFIKKNQKKKELFK